MVEKTTECKHAEGTVSIYGPCQIIGTIIRCARCNSVFLSLCLYNTEYEKSHGPYHWLAPGEKLGCWGFSNEFARKFQNYL